MSPSSRPPRPPSATAAGRRCARGRSRSSASTIAVAARNARRPPSRCAPPTRHDRHAALVAPRDDRGDLVRARRAARAASAIPRTALDDGLVAGTADRRRAARARRRRCARDRRASSSTYPVQGRCPRATRSTTRRARIRPVLEGPRARRSCARRTRASRRDAGRAARRPRRQRRRRARQAPLPALRRRPDDPLAPAHDRLVGRLPHGRALAPRAAPRLARAAAARTARWCSSTARCSSC